MSQYSEVVGSFLRRGSFPLEADYLFTTVDELKSYYEKPENKAILHRGLFKIVEDDGTGNQGLFWVTKKTDSEELEFTELISGSSNISDTLEELSKKLEEEIQNRKNGDNAIYGTTDPTNISADLDSILDLSTAITNLRNQVNDTTSSQQSLRKELLAAVGSQYDTDIIEYLKTLSFSSITDLSNRLDNFFNKTNMGGEIDTWKELQIFLTGISDDKKLVDLIANNLNVIYGSPIPTEEFRTLRGIEDFVRKLQSTLENSDNNLIKELDATQVGVGLNSDGSFSADSETNYLSSATSVMNALRILDAKVKELAITKTIESNNSDVIQLYFNNSSDKTTIDAVLKLSAESGNNLVKKTDGLYIKINSEYADGILTLKVNDSIVGQHYLGLGTSIVSDVYYDSPNETLVIVFDLGNNKTQTVRVPLSTLIREWVVDNTYADKVVVLTREEDFTSGADKLSADVRLLVDKYNILVKSGNSLYVKGTSDNIVHNDVKISILLDELLKFKEDQGDLSESISNIQQSVEKIEDTVQQIRTDVDSNKNNIFNHINDHNNPHNVTAEQVGAYTTEDIDDKLKDKADLVNGIVPEEQLPKLNWIEVP